MKHGFNGTHIIQISGIPRRRKILRFMGAVRTKSGRRFRGVDPPWSSKINSHGGGGATWANGDQGRGIEILTSLLEMGNFGT